MPTHVVTASAPVEFRLPPYEKSAGDVHLEAVRGTAMVAIVTIPPSDCAGEQTIATVSSVRRRFPEAAIALLIREFTPQAIAAAVCAKGHAVRGLVFGTVRLNALRSELTGNADLGGAVVGWFDDAGILMRRPTRALIAEIVDAPPNASALSQVFALRVRKERTVRNSFRISDLPAPRVFFALARLLHAALAIQRDNQRPLLDIAMEAGYSDAAGLAHQMRRVLGLRPGQVRGTLGWEWLLDHWCRRTGLLPTLGQPNKSSGAPDAYLRRSEESPRE
jgi:AraC-like DNA-binding protein